MYQAKIGEGHYVFSPGDHPETEGQVASGVCEDLFQKSSCTPTLEGVSFSLSWKNNDS